MRESNQDYVKGRWIKETGDKELDKEQGGDIQRYYQRERERARQRLTRRERGRERGRLGGSESV